MTTPDASTPTTTTRPVRTGKQLAIGVAVAVLATALFVIGLLTASTTRYLIGLCLIPIAFTLLVTVARPLRSVRARTLTLLVTAGVVITAGVLIPRAVLQSEFDGDGVAWQVAGIESGYGVALVTSEVAVLRDTGGTLALHSLADGRRLGQITAGSSDSILGAGPNVLIEPAPGPDTSFRLFGPDGTLLWERAVPDYRFAHALAYADGVTVLEICPEDGCRRYGVSASGEDLWESGSTPFFGKQSYPLPRERGALPTVAVWPEALADDESAPLTRSDCGCNWQFVAPADGSVLMTGPGNTAVVVDDPDTGPAFVVFERGTGNALTEFRLTDSLGGTATGTVPVTGTDPLAVGPYLVVFDNSEATLVDTRPQASERTFELDVRLPTDTSDPYGENGIGLTGAGLVVVDGTVVTSTGWGATGPSWTFDTDEVDTNAAIGPRSVAVVAALERSNPMDSGYNRISDTRDRRVTVLEPATGAVIAQVRTHWRPRVTPIPGGALVLDSDVMMLVGSYS